MTNLPHCVLPEFPTHNNKWLFYDTKFWAIVTGALVKVKYNNGTSRKHFHRQEASGGTWPEQSGH